MAFTYKEDELFVDELRVADIVRDVGTPVYIYSLRKLVENFAAYQRLPNSLICFAVKANSSLAVLRAIGGLGGGADIVSMGEMILALAAGIPAERIVFSGVGKTRREIAFAIEKRIHQIHVESLEELTLVNQVAAEQNRTICVSIRLNPDVDAHTHHKITTGTKVNKFGISASQLVGIDIKKYPHVDFMGISTHVGSSIKSLDVFRQMVDVIQSVIPRLLGRGWNVRRIDVGGGLGIPYAPNDQYPAISEYVELMKNAFAGTGFQIICEPGRSVVGNCGILVSEVVYKKVGYLQSITHVILDAGMNDFVRPAMYGALHQIIPLKRDEKAAKIKADIVGPVCETGDTFANDYEIQDLRSGDLVAICDSGAYGMSLASTYNSRPLPAEVLVNGDSYKIVRERGTYEALLQQSMMTGE